MTSHYKWIHVFFLLCFLLPHTFQAFFHHLGCVNPLTGALGSLTAVKAVSGGYLLVAITIAGLFCLGRSECVFHPAQNPSKVTGLLGRWVAEIKDTLPETNSSSLKIDPWKRRFLLETTIFRGICL